MCFQNTGRCPERSSGQLEPWWRTITSEQLIKCEAEGIVHFWYLLVKIGALSIQIQSKNIEEALTDPFKNFEEPGIIQHDSWFSCHLTMDQVLWDVVFVDQPPTVCSSIRFVGAGATSGPIVTVSICLIWWKCGNSFILRVIKFYRCVHIFVSI